MVQKDKKLKRTQIGIKEKVSRAAPRKELVKPKVAPHERKLSVAIGKNIEQLMAARVSHEGGTLRIIHAPENVTEYIKSGPQMSKLQVRIRSGQVAHRKIKADKHQELLLGQINKAIKDEAKEAERKKAKEVKDAYKAPQIDMKITELADDDVAGDFFDEEIGEDFKPVIEVPKDIGINLPKKRKGKKGSSAPISLSITKEKKSEQMPGRKSGFKGVTDTGAGNILDEAF